MPIAEKPGLKICLKCGKEFPLSEDYFYYSAHLSKGKRYWHWHSACKKCVRENQRLYRQEQSMEKRERSWEKARTELGKRSNESNIIDRVDDFLSYHGVDFLALVKARNESVKRSRCNGKLRK